MISFIYLCLLLFIIIFSLYLIKKNNKVAPKKIKILLSLALLPLILRYLVLVLGVIIEKQSIIYLLRSFVFLNYYSIPLLVLVSLFIFLRDEKLKFDMNFIFLGLLLVGYIALIFTCKLSIYINNIFGFIVALDGTITPILIYLILLASLAVVTLLFIDKPYNNKVGMRYILLSLILCIVEFILHLGGVKLFPYPIIGDIAILLVTLKALTTFK